MRSRLANSQPRWILKMEKLSLTFYRRIARVGALLVLLLALAFDFGASLGQAAQNRSGCDCSAVKMQCCCQYSGNSCCHLLPNSSKNAPQHLDRVQISGREFFFASLTAIGNLQPTFSATAFLRNRTMNFLKSRPPPFASRCILLI